MKRFILNPKLTSTHRLVGTSLIVIAVVCNTSRAYEQYTDPDGGCVTCHGNFRDTTSTKGTVFPKGKNHDMHRDSAYMATACELCHTGDSDSRTPVYIGSSNGTNGIPGLGCTGCHVASGLRLHHKVNGVTECYDCHDPETAEPEHVMPPYYGTAYTKANNPGNTVLATNINENWSVGDYLGVDNDGNNLYDLADYTIGPFRLLSVSREGNNLRVTWQTAKGRTDAVQAAGGATGSYSNVGSLLAIPGVGLVTTNYLEVGGATNPVRFFRLTGVLP